jgi:hypothetical protein
MSWALENQGPVDPPAPLGSTMPIFGKTLPRDIHEEESSGGSYDRSGRSVIADGVIIGNLNFGGQVRCQSTSKIFMWGKHEKPTSYQ